MKLTIAISALLGLMSADQVQAVARHQRHYAVNRYAQMRQDGDNATAPGEQYSTSDSGSESGSESSGSESESESSGSETTGSESSGSESTSGEQAQQDEGGQQQQAAGGQ